MSDNKIKEENQNNLVGSSLLEFLYIVAKARKFLLILTFTFIVVALLWALLTPKEYKAMASVLPAEQSDLLSGLTGISSLAKSFSPFKGLGSLTGADELDRYIAILKSKKVHNKVIEDFDLRKVYDLEDQPLWKVERELSGNLDYTIEDEGNLVISVYDRNPELAAKIANYMVNLLNEINTELHITNAKSVREFIEKRYFQNLDDITALETQMKQFQKKYGVIAVPEQIEVTIQTIAKLYAELAKQEVELNVMKKTIASDSPLLVTKEIQIKELQNKLNLMSSSDKINNRETDVLIPLNLAPDLVGKYLNIFKNLEIQYKIAEFITPVYEQAKIEEARSTPSVLVLDKASPPERKAKPKISLYVLIGFILSLVIGLFLVFTLELLRKLQQINPQKFSYISKIFGPFSRLIIQKSETDKPQ